MAFFSVEISSLDNSLMIDFFFLFLTFGLKIFPISSSFSSKFINESKSEIISSKSLFLISIDLESSQTFLIL